MHVSTFAALAATALGSSGLLHEADPALSRTPPAGIERLTPAPALLCGERSVSRGWIVEVDLGPASASGHRDFALETPEGELRIAVGPYSPRSADFAIYVSNVNGGFTEVPAPAPTTVRGRVAGIDGARVAGSIDDGDLSLVILHPDGRRMVVEPLGEPGGAHFLYDTADVLDRGARCGVDHQAQAGVDSKPHARGDGAARGRGIDARDPSWTGRAGSATEFDGIAGERDGRLDASSDAWVEGTGDGSGAGDGGVAESSSGASLRWAQVAVDVDFPCFIEHGLDFTSVARRVDATFNLMNAQYESQCGISHLVSGVLIRTSAATDPYDDGAACTQFPDTSGMAWDVQGEWRSSPPVAFPFDAVTLFTGRSHPEGTGWVVGCAFIDSICNQNAFIGPYGFIEPNFAGLANATFPADDLAHELGHMWSAGHCACASPPSTMNAFITGGLTFAPESAAAIISHRNAHPSCFELAPDPPAVGCGGGESCYVAHATPWCSDAECCAIVCAQDAYCCEIGGQWDSLCRQAAASFCGACGTGTEACALPHATPGCWDRNCCAVVCAQDAYCCDVVWDLVCANASQSLCQIGETCAEAIPIAANGSQGVTTGPVLPGGTPCTASATRPRWFSFTPSATGLAKVRLCGGEFDVGGMQGAIYEGCGGPQIRCGFDTDADPACTSGPSVVLTFPAIAGQDYRIRLAQANGAQLYSAVVTIDFTVTAGCGAAGVPGCFVEHLSPSCADAECCATVCGADPFCCGVRWDSFCVEQAIDRCWWLPYADVNGDGVVNAADLAELLGNWGLPGVSDLDGSGATDAADLAQLLGGWG